MWWRSKRKKWPIKEPVARKYATQGPSAGSAEIDPPLQNSIVRKAPFDSPKACLGPILVSSSLCFVFRQSIPRRVLSLLQPPVFVVSARILPPPTFRR